MTGKRIFLIVMIVLLAVVSFVAFQFMRQINTLREVRAQAAQLHQQLNTADAKTSELQNDIKDSQTDSWVERMARDILGWVKKGDVKIVDDGGK